MALMRAQIALVIGDPSGLHGMSPKTRVGVRHYSLPVQLDL
jgi:hypothetical protein